MVLDRLFPSMFQRRLLLLLACVSAAFALLAGQVWRLTIARGDELRSQAEQRLTRTQWTPTVRGRILDRKGRVLAQDRPSYDIAVDYRVLTGAWAEDRALAAARRRHGAGWPDLTPAQRAEETARLVPFYRQHLEHARDDLARLCAVDRATIERAADGVLASIDSVYRHTVEVRRQALIRAARGRGDELTPALLRAIDRQASQELAEQRSAHVILRRVSDQAAFDCKLLMDEETDLDLGAATASREAWSDRVPRCPGMKVFDAGDRDYPLESATVEADRATLPGPLRAQGHAAIRVDGLACHILGSLRDRLYGTSTDAQSGRVTIGDAQARREFLAANPASAADALAPDGSDRGAYREGDRVGATGIEASQEHVLRGLRGMQTLHLDTGERPPPIPAMPGRDVPLTIDIMLQARVQAAMSPDLGLSVIQPWHATQRTDEFGRPIPGIRPDGSTLYGAAVVLDVDSGDILAMVSTPTYTRAQVRDAPETVFGDSAELQVTTPWLNRAVAKSYQPGSIVKAVILCEAVTRGNFRLDQRIACTGHLLPDKPDMLRCWIYKRNRATHTDQLGHELDASEAIMVSCNIFFFTLGRRLGPDGVAAAFRDFGVGDVFDLGLARPGHEREAEFPGVLGSPPGSALDTGQAIQIGIGQGPIAWTPLHAANAYATLARRGMWVPPRLITGRPRPQPRDLGLDQRAIDAAMEGLRLSVGSRLGTGDHISFDGRNEPIFNAPGVKIWGKTGTADASPIVGDPDGPDGPLPPRVLEAGDHSWFVVLVGRDRPQYAIAVVSDYGGSGGKVSGPITNQIIHALIAEGYL